LCSAEDQIHTGLEHNEGVDMMTKFSFFDELSL